MKKIKQIIIRTIISISSFFYQKVKYKSNTNFVKVNLGCGLQCLPGWINIDGSLTALFSSKKITSFNKFLYKLSGASKYHSFDFYNKVLKTCNLKFYNLKMGVPLRDNSANIIYCSHFLEHLNSNDGKYFLKECLRSLEKGGLFRIVVPDLDFALAMYRRGEIEKMLDLFFYTSDSCDFAAHKHNYNFTYLKNILEIIGFTNIKKLSYRTGKCPNIRSLDTYPNHSLYIECRK